MKRIVCLLLALLPALCGCLLKNEEIHDPVTFYYLRAEVIYDTADGVISGETLEGSGHTGDLNDLLTWYLGGPTDEHLRTPFPGDVRLAAAEPRESALGVELEGSFSAMSDLEISKACACLALTCFGLTEAETVSISLSDQAESSNQTIEITRDSLILQDVIPEAT